MLSVSTRMVCIGECMVELSERADGTIGRAFGGDTLNTALYLARLGVSVDYATVLGDDPFSDEMVVAWRKEGIGTDLVLRLPGRLPGLYLIRTDGAGERTFFHWRDSAPVRDLFAAPGLATVTDAVMRAGLIYVSGITLSLFAGAAREALFALLRQARAAGARIAFDTNYRARGWPDPAAARAAYEQAFSLSDIVLAGVEDLTPVFGSADLHDAPHDAMARLRAAGVTEALIKLADPACHVMNADGNDLVIADPVTAVVDTTAAGDSFAAGYLAARAAGRQPIDAARAGHRLAGVVIGHRGAIIPRASMPSPSLEARP